MSDIFCRIINWVLLIPAFLFCQPLAAQVVAIQSELQNIAWMNVANPLTIAAYGVPPADVVVSTSNGEVRVDSFAPIGHYSLWTAHIGVAVIYVGRRTPSGATLLLDSSRFEVRTLGKPYATFAGKKQGSLSQPQLMAQIAPFAIMNDVCAHFPIISFMVEVYRRDTPIFQHSIYDSKHARIDPVTSDFFHQLMDGDRLYLKHITVRKVDGDSVTTEPLAFTITGTHRYRIVYAADTITVIDPVTGNEQQKIRTSRYERADEH